MEDKKMSEFTEVSSLTGDMYLTGWESGSPNRNIMISKDNLIAQLGVRPYVSLAGNITQSGTDDPAVTEMENSIGDVVFSRDSAGIYYGTLIGAFPEGLTWFSINPNYGNTTDISRIDNDTIRIKTQTDGKLTDVSFEIRVYEDES